MRFLMDFIMPPFRSSKCMLDMSSNKNNNYFIPLPSTSNDHVKHKCCDYPPKVLGNLNQLRQNSRFCDVEIVAGDKIIKAHKAVLAASSNYFQAMFTGGLCEKDQNSVELHAISSHILEILINFIYSGEVCINQNNVQELIVAADMLELHEVVLGCSDFLIKELHPINAVGIFRFAEAHNCTELMTASYEFILNNFPQVCNEDEIYDLPKDQIIKFLSSEHVKVDSEFQVFQAAIRWITHDIMERRRYVFEILKHVRLPLFSLGLLERAVNECNDSSLKVALKSVHNDLVNRKGCLVPLTVNPRICAKKDIYVIGGNKREFVWHRGSESYCVSVVKFDTFKREWSTAPDLLVNRIVPGVATLNGRIYVVGGEQESNSLSCCECYDPQLNSWKLIASMIVPRCEFGLCALNGYLYALGGWIGDDIGGCIERYDTKKDEWKHVGVLPQPRFSMGVVAYKGLIYMVGGCTANQRHLADLLSFDPLTGDWKTLPSMSVARSQMGVAVIDDYLYVIGGDNKHQVLDSVERYSFKKNKWSSVPSMSVARSRPAVAAVDGLVYVIGELKQRRISIEHSSH
ncbi:kelch protein [Holotrichia oblita]|uniref:Kelch protein n=1 Tax=Holotrichia oblita TaxID=644536 RepID=A0ACB9T3C3_HOLOL|nr:kelch protein [Holotrichia oblita]